MTHCPDCGEAFEQVAWNENAVPGSNAAAGECPECGAVLGVVAAIR